MGNENELFYVSIQSKYIYSDVQKDILYNSIKEYVLSNLKTKINNFMKKQPIAQHSDFPNHKLSLCYAKDKWAFESIYKGRTVRSAFEYRTMSEAQDALMDYLYSQSKF